jgi:hypothetical protein
MSDAIQIDLSRFTGIRAQSGGRSASEGESVQALPQRGTRAQPEVERSPDYQQRGTEAEGYSNFSGGKWGGGTWAGRSRDYQER